MTDQPPLTQQEFAQLLDALDSDTFAGFVADLWAESGWKTERSGSLIRVRRLGSEEQCSIHVRGESNEVEIADEVDVIATRSRQAVPPEMSVHDRNVVILGPDELFQRLRYALDRETQEELLWRYFDRSATFPTPEPGAGPDQGGKQSTPGSIRETPEKTGRQSLATLIGAHPVGTVAIVIVVVSLVVAVILAGIGPFGGLGESDTPEAPMTTITDTGRANMNPASGGDPSNVSPEPVPTVTRGEFTEPVETRVFSPQPRYKQLQPTCERPPSLVVSILLGALRNNDPETNDGIRAAWNFSAKGLGSNYPSFVDFLRGEDVELFFTYRAVTFGEFEHGDGMATQEVTLIGPEGRQEDFVFALSMVERGSNEGCWQLAGAIPV